MKFQFDDGGRKEAGFKGNAGDCACRAVAIATGLPYRQVYEAINILGAKERVGKRKRGTSNARTGVYSKTLRKFMESIGWQWVPTMQIGSGCKVHLRAEELPIGRIVARVSKHYVAVVNGVVHDTYEDDRNGTRCVYGYWIKA